MRSTSVERPRYLYSAAGRINVFSVSHGPDRSNWLPSGHVSYRSYPTARYDPEPVKVSCLAQQPSDEDCVGATMKVERGIRTAGTNFTAWAVKLSCRGRSYLFRPDGPSDRTEVHNEASSILAAVAAAALQRSGHGGQLCQGLQGLLASPRPREVRQSYQPSRSPTSAARPCAALMPAPPATSASRPTTSSQKLESASEREGLRHLQARRLAYRLAEREEVTRTSCGPNSRSPCGRHMAPTSIRQTVAMQKSVLVGFAILALATAAAVSARDQTDCGSAYKRVRLDRLRRKQLSPERLAALAVRPCVIVMRVKVMTW